MNIWIGVGVEKKWKSSHAEAESHDGGKISGGKQTISSMRWSSENHIKVCIILILQNV